MAKQKSKSKSAAKVNKVKLARPVKLVRKPLRKARTYVRPVGRAALRKVASRKVGKVGKDGKTYLSIAVDRFLPKQEGETYSRQPIRQEDDFGDQDIPF